MALAKAFFQESTVDLWLICILIVGLEVGSESGNSQGIFSGRQNKSFNSDILIPQKNQQL
jgi:hypothetical protein